MPLDSREPHKEDKEKSALVPELFGATPGVSSWLGRLGTWALPAETVTVASAVAMAAMFVLLSLSESSRFFFRFSFPPMWLSGPAAAVTAFVAWRGSRRPGPPLPRWWVALLTLVNLALLGAAAYSYTAPNVPAWLSDPFPLHPLTLSAAVASVLLLPRLYPMHPLKTLVQTVAPLALASVLSIAIPLSIWLLTGQMTREQETLTQMSRNLDAIAASLRAAGRFPYAGHVSPGAEDGEMDVVLEGLTLQSPPSLPDARRWQANSILENEGLVPRDDLERSVRGLIDAVHDLFIEANIPELKAPRYLALGRANGQYQPNDEWARARPDRHLFEPAARLALDYFNKAAKWPRALGTLSNGRMAGYYQEKMRAVDSHLATLRRRASTLWWATLIKRAGDGDEDPPGDLAAVFTVPLAANHRSIADMTFWSRLPFGRRSALRLGPDGPCRLAGRYQSTTAVQAVDYYNDKLIKASPESLTEAQVSIGQDHYEGESYSAFTMVQCFGYHAPFSPPPVDSSALIVVELRLTYDHHNLEVRAPAPCPAKCWTRTLPANRVPTSVDVFVDLPDHVSNPDAYAEVVAKTFTSSVGNAAVNVAHSVEQQGDAQRVVRLHVTGR